MYLDLLHPVLVLFLQQQLPEILIDYKKQSKYEIDGIIISDINHHIRNTDGNPDYSFAYKENVEMKDAIVEEVEWNVSKDGYLKPRVQIEPINLGGVTIEFATGFNAAFIKDNSIGIGSTIQIIRTMLHGRYIFPGGLRLRD